MQKYLRNAETDPLDAYYQNGERVDENTARNRIVEYLKPILQSLDISTAIEKHMAGGNRCDFTAETLIDGKQSILVVEVKGQWHKALFTAAKEQLHTRYSLHPDAAEQGIYLVLWFGKYEAIAGKKTHDVNSQEELKAKIISEMPFELHTRIDVVVLDLSV